MKRFRNLNLIVLVTGFLFTGTSKLLAQGPKASDSAPLATTADDGVSRAANGTAQSAKVGNKRGAKSSPPMPASDTKRFQPPQVSFSNGLLVISAVNCTLDQVLGAVQERTGITVDFPPSAASERVMAHLGPGKPKDVLIALLNGTNFGFALVEPPGDSGGVQTLILTVKQDLHAGTTSIAHTDTPPDNSPAVASKPEDSPEQTQLANDRSREAGPAQHSSLSPDQNAMQDNLAMPQNLQQGQQQSLQQVQSLSPGQNATQDNLAMPQNPQQGQQQSPQQVQSQEQQLHLQRWMMIDQQHTAQMSDPANQAAGPPPAPPIYPLGPAKQ